MSERDATPEACNDVRPMMGTVPGGAGKLPDGIDPSMLVDRRSVDLTIQPPVPPSEPEALPCPMCGPLTQQIAAKAERERIIGIIRHDANRYTMNPDQLDRILAEIRGGHHE